MYLLWSLSAALPCSLPPFLRWEREIERERLRERLRERERERGCFNFLISSATCVIRCQYFKKFEACHILWHHAFFTCRYKKTSENVDHLKAEKRCLVMEGLHCISDGLWILKQSDWTECACSSLKACFTFQKHTDHLRSRCGIMFNNLHHWKWIRKGNSI